MAQSLGSLYVELLANTAKFIGPLSEAARLAQKSARDISREFGSLSRIASQTFGAFGSFNPIVSQLGFALSSAGRAASEAMGALGKTHSVLGNISALGVGATTAFLSVEAGMVGMAVHATEGAAKLYELSQSTGVSTEALSGLGFAAKQSGVDSQVMITGLERMNRSAFAAANAPVGAINAYTRLGIALRDSAGQMRSTESIFADLAGRFASMPDGVNKTALAIQIFGRSGAELIPVLNRGREGINQLLETADRLGLVISGHTAASAEEFQQALGRLSAVATGFANVLMVEMLPTLQAVVTWLENLGRTAQSVQGAVPDGGFWRDAIQFTVKGLAYIETALLEIVGLAGQAVDALAIVASLDLWKKPAENMVALQRLMDSNADSVRNLFAEMQKANEMESKRPQMIADILKFAGTKPDPGLARFLEGMSGEQLEKLAADAMKAHQNVADFATSLMKLKQIGDLPARQKTVMLPVAQADVVDKLVTSMRAQTDAELALAGATNLSAAALVVQKAAGEADTKIAEIRAALLEREKTLEEQLANAKANQKGEEAARLAAEIAGVHGLLTELSTDVPQIQTLYVELAAAKEAVRIGGEMSKEGLGFDREIASLEDFVTAYRQGGAAIASAGVDKQLEEDKQRVAELLELYAQVFAADPFNVPTLVALGDSLANANAMLDEHRSKLEQIRALNIDNEIAKQTAAYKDEAGAIAELDQAYLKNAAAVRAAEVDVKVAQFRTSNPGASADQIAAVTDLYRKQSQEAWNSSVAQVAAQYQVGRAYDDEIAKLSQAREVLQSVGQSTLLVDAAIDAANDKNNKQWDEAAMKVGTLNERFSAFLDEVRMQGDNLGEKVFGSLSKSLDDLSTKLADFIVTGKSSFRQLAASLAENLLKTSFQSTFSNLASLAEGKLHPGSASAGVSGPASAKSAAVSSVAAAFGIKLPGPEGKKPTGTRGDPIYVISAAAAAAGAGVLGGNLGAASTPPFLAPGLTNLSLPAATVAGEVTSTLGNLPLGPGFGTGKPSAETTSLFGPLGIPVPSSPVSAIASAFGVGGGGKPPAGTSSSPVFVSIVNKLAAPGAPGALGSLFSNSSSGGSSDEIGNLPLGPGFGSGAPMSSLMSLMIPETSTSAGGGGLLSSSMGIGKDFMGLFSAIGGGGAGGFLAGLSKIGGLFAGFLAGGGEAKKGAAYLVGEKGPELFMPNATGTIYPSFSAMKPAAEENPLTSVGQAFDGYRAAGGQVIAGKSYVVGENHTEVYVPGSDSRAGSAGGAGARQTIVQFHVHGVQDHDSFRRAQSQIYSNLHAQMELARSRG